ncbi:DUF1499 domain-containing protein [Paracoccaceae bacterium GXU_MW_L88]
MKLLLILVALVVIGFAAWVRLAPSDPEAWHVEPEKAKRTGKPNDYLVAEGGDREPLRITGDANALAQNFDSQIMENEAVQRLAGDPSTGHATYIARSKLMGYPDYISLQFTQDGPETVVTAYSRSRFGHSDMGVNKARLTRWLDLLAQ